MRDNRSNIFPDRASPKRIHSSEDLRSVRWQAMTRYRGSPSSGSAWHLVCAIVRSDIARSEDPPSRPILKIGCRVLHSFFSRSSSGDFSAPSTRAARERVLHSQPTGPNPLHHLDDFSRPALRYGIFNSLFRVAWGWILCEDRIHNSRFKSGLKRFTATLISNCVKHNETLRF